MKAVHCVIATNPQSAAIPSNRGPEKAKACTSPRPTEIAAARGPCRGFVLHHSQKVQVQFRKGVESLIIHWPS